MAHAVVHWEIGGRDLDRLSLFYKELFDWEGAGFDPNYRLVTPPEGLGGGLMRCPDDTAPYVTVYVSVDDLDATLVRVKELGGAPFVPPTPIPGVGSFALFKDPDGNILGILQMPTGV
ncbi:MAG TPA: VOC family protein [Acidimicrobiales bacterium]|nr:VOC family protein [Acidimicrobiales bacterium]